MAEDNGTVEIVRVTKFASGRYGMTFHKLDSPDGPLADIRLRRDDVEALNIRACKNCYGDTGG